MSVATGGLTKGFKKAREKVHQFTGSVDVSGKALTVLAVKAAAVLGPFIALNKIISGVKESLTDLGETSRLANRIGADVEQLSSLQFAATSSGIGIERFNDALSDMTEKLGDARIGGGEGIEVLDKLGLSADELAGKDPAEVFTTIAGGISKLENQADKLTLADKMFGDVGQELIPLIDQGEAGIRKLQARAEELGVSFNSLDAANVAMANSAMKELKAVITGVYRQLAINVAPIITAIARKFTQLGTEGVNVSDMIVTGMKWVSKGIGVAADVVDVFHDLWKFLQAGVTKYIGLILQGVATLGKAIQTLANKLPGVDIAFGDTLQSMADGVNELAYEQWKQAKEEFIKPPPSVGIKKFFKDINAEAKQAAENMKKNGLGQTTMNDPAKEVISSLKQQIEVLKVGADQAKLNELKTQGVSEAMLKQVSALQSQKKALEESKKAAEELKKRQEALTEKFKSPVEKFKTEFMKLKKLLDKGLITKDTFKSAALDALPDKVKSIIEKTKTPTQKFQEQLKELQNFKNAGLLNDQQFTKAKQELAKELGQTGEVKLASAAEFGSQEARSSILKNRLGNRDPMKDALKVNQEQLEEQKKLPPLLAKIANNTVEVLAF